MMTGYSIFGNPVESMDGAVRAVSIMPRYLKPGAFAADVPTSVAMPPPPPHHPMTARGGVRTTHVRQHLGPGGMAPPMAHPGLRPGGMIPPPHRVPAPGGMVPGGGGGAPPTGTWVGSRPPPPMHQPGMRPPPMHRYTPHQTMPLPAGPPPMPMPMGPQPMIPSPGGGCAPCAPCGGPQVPLMGQIQFYNPTPRAPIAPMQACPMPAVPAMQQCGVPLDSQGAALYHPGGAYPITQHGPGLNDGLTRSPITHGQLPVGAGVDIFGGTLSVEDASRSRPIGDCPPCATPVPMRAPLPCGSGQPQHGYNRGSGIFNPHAGVFGASPDGLGRWY